jgi:hypothetical protein
VRTRFAVSAGCVALLMAELPLPGSNRDYTLRILPKANHLQLEAKVGNNAEMTSLQRLVPAYFETIQAWLAQRIRGFKA